MTTTKRWTIVVDIEGQQGMVHAVARLHDRSPDRLIGKGSAWIGPAERSVPAVCERVAAARALGQLRQSLLDRAQAEFKDATDRKAARARASTAAARSAAQNANRA
jgi:hypothetical protein